MGTPRCIGLALRGRALVAEGVERLGLLGEAVEVRAGSQAALEHARALCDLGAELRGAGERSDARAPLTRALELARCCGATVLEKRARTELRAAGARPLRAVRTGLDALTASERRIAEMAAAGRSNPETAQALFLTVKTVEGTSPAPTASLTHAPGASWPGRSARPAPESPGRGSRVLRSGERPWRAT